MVVWLVGAGSKPAPTLLFGLWRPIPRPPGASPALVTVLWASLARAPLRCAKGARRPGGSPLPLVPLCQFVDGAGPGLADCVFEGVAVWSEGV